MQRGPPSSSTVHGPSVALLARASMASRSVFVIVIPFHFAETDPTISVNIHKAPHDPFAVSPEHVNVMASIRPARVVTTKGKIWLRMGRQAALTTFCLPLKESNFLSLCEFDAFDIRYVHVQHRSCIPGGKQLGFGAWTGG